MIHSMHLGLTSACNLNCKHCFVHNKKMYKLNEHKALELIGRLEEQGLTHLYYTYGEPLLYDNLFDFIDEVGKYGIYQVLMTNGYFIDSNIADKIADSKINRVMVSLDSDNAFLHDKNRGKLGCFDRAINAIKLLKDKKINVGISTTVTASNVKSLVEIGRLAELLGVDYISFLALRNDGKIDLKFETEYVDFFIDCILKKKRYVFHDYRFIPWLKQLHKIGAIDDEKYQALVISNSCNASKIVSLAPNGDIYGCNLAKQDVIANVYVDSIDLILDRIKKNDCKEKRCKLYEV